MFFFGQDLSDGIKYFEHVTLNVTFGILLKNLYIAYNFLTIRDRAFKFDACGSYDKTFLLVP